MTSSVKRQTFDPGTQELVILVHGTFANNPSKTRSDHLRWWQGGGDVWEKIDQQLPEQFHVASDTNTEIFSWSGDNSERDRRAGGRERARACLRVRAHSCVCARARVRAHRHARVCVRALRCV